MNHTQGEWKIKHSESKPAFNVIGTVLGGKYKVARVPYGLLQDGQPFDKEEAEANAKLIAASPDLLESCKSMIKAFEDAPPEWLQTKEVAEAEISMMVAIAKATID